MYMYIRGNISVNMLLIVLNPLPKEGRQALEYYMVEMID